MDSELPKVSQPAAGIGGGLPLSAAMEGGDVEWKSFRRAA